MIHDRIHLQINHWGNLTVLSWGVYWEGYISAEEGEEVQMSEVKDMRVDDLIKILKRFDPNLRIAIGFDEARRQAIGYYKQGEKLYIYA